MVYYILWRLILLAKISKYYGSGNEIGMQQPQPMKMSTTSPALVSLLLAAKSCIKEVSAIGEAHQLSLDEWLILDALNANEGLTMSQLQQHCVGAASSTTRAVDRMVERALVFREIGQADRRQVFVHISALGKSTYSAMAHELSDIEQQLKQQFADATIAQETLRAVLEKLS